ncbi:hypothetical protein RE428_01420 [Marinobacter nanhaiticus D15-8W]|nr:hypothetical protein RE428_01420 [Marinobacter nanhaiticus D15-8W]
MPEPTSSEAFASSPSLQTSAPRPGPSPEALGVPAGEALLRYFRLHPARGERLKAASCYNTL